MLHDFKKILKSFLFFSRKDLILILEFVVKPGGSQYSLKKEPETTETNRERSRNHGTN